MKKQYLTAAFLCALSSATYAETELSLDEVVVTATRIEQPLKQTLSSTTVISQEEIKNSQASDVPTILRNVAGVEISQNGGYGKPASIFLRGSNSTQVLVLLDGVRINSATSGTTSIEHLMLDQIERIEVVRGNVSSLYGSEAVGGVIQIFTKRGRDDPAFNITAGAGNHGTQRIAAGFGGKIEHTDFNLHASRFITEGVSALNPDLYPRANPDNDGYANTSISANVRHALNADHRLSANIFNSQGHNQFDSGFSPDVATDIHNNDVQVNKVSVASENRLGDSWLSKLQLSQGVDSSQSYKNGLLASPGSLYKTTNQQATWLNTINLSSNNQLLAGIETLKQQVTSDLQPAYLQDERRINSLFAGYTGSYGEHQLQTNLRQDNNSQYGIANTGLLGYGYTISETWRATTSYSTAYRAPTFNQLYYPNYGNANLKPERSINKEAGLHYTNDGHHINVTYFDIRTNDLIDSAPKNINEARIDGVELSYAGQFGKTAVKTAITIQNPRDLTNNKSLDRRSTTHSNVAVTHKLDALQIGGEWLYSDTRPDGTRTLAAYHVFNLTAAYELSKQFKLSMRADNITDQNDSSVYGYNPLGRTFFASVSYQQ